MSPGAWMSERPVAVEVHGGSMSPFIEEGDKVVVRRASKQDFLLGDLVVFMRGEELVVHRIVALRPGRFLEMGDAQERGNWHSWPEETGRVLAVMRGKGVEIDLAAPPLRHEASKRARRMRLRHLCSVLAGALPGALTRRILRKAARPLLRPVSALPGFDAEGPEDHSR